MKQGEVEVTYFASDFLALNLLIWRFWLGLILIVATLLIAVPVLLTLIDGYRLDQAVAAIHWPFTALVVSILILWLLVVTMVKYWWQRRQGLHGPIIFALTEEGVSFRNRQMGGVVFWNAIKAIRIRGQRIFLFVTRRSGLILPRRAFSSEAEFEGFAAAACERWSQRHQK